MPFPSSTEWEERAEVIYVATRDLGKEMAVLVIAKALMDTFAEGANYISDAIKLAQTPKDVQ